MASLQDVIDILIQVDDQASAAIGAVGDAMGELDSKVQSVASPLASLANGVLAADTALAALAVTVGALAVKETVQFQDSMYLVTKQLDGTGVSAAQAKADIEALALQYGTNANDVAQSMAGFLAAGNDYKTSAGLVETATRLMIAGELDAQTATDAINKSLAGFRVPAEDAASSATKVGDVLNKIGDISSGKFEEIVRGFTDISPTAKDAGLTMEQTAAYTAVLVDVFGSGSEAATSLKSGLLSLLTPSKEAEETLKKLGVSTTDSNGNLRSANDILTDLAGKWDTLTESQKLQTAAVIFGKEQAGAMNTLLGDWGKAQDYVAQMLDKTTGATGSMAKEVEGKLKLISTQIDVSQEAWRQFLEHLGAKLVTDGLDGFTGSVGKLGTAFKGVVDSGGFDEIIDWAKDGLSELSEIIDQVAENLPEAFDGVDWSGLIDALDDLAETASGLFTDIFGDVDLTTVDGLTSAIQTTITIIESLVRTTDGIAQAFKPAAQAIGETVDKFSALDSESQVDFGETIGSAKLLIEAGTGLGVALIAVGKAGLDMSDVLDAVFGGLKVAINAVQVAFDTAVLGILKLAQTTLAALGFDEKAAELQTAIDGVYENALRNSQELKDGWAQATGESSAATDKWREKLDTASEALKGMAAEAKSGSGAVEDLGDSVGSVAGSFTDMQLAGDEAVDFLERLNKGLGTGYSSIDEFNQAVEDGSVVFNTATQSWEQAADAVKKTEDAAKAAADGVKKNADATENADAKAKGYKVTIENGVTVFTQYGAAATKSADALSENAKKAEEATRASAEYLTKMEEIASNERIKTIEATVQLKTAQFEADATRVAAAFSSIGTTVSSTGDVLGTLFQSLTDANTWYEKSKIAEQIDLENSRREDALELQEKLVEAEIKRIEAQTERLTKDDAMIKIDATGLEPEIEAFMWKILGKIQVRANASMQDYLLGIDAL